ncbi:hypothetical protein SOASR014_37730 [Pectobacterium carotovorum subsp. carotovorum]|nr:hypothetical protein SOASR014_37730 [Pectobacterium carotovorum subsp. carotovorum]GLX46177.1 hypothetical protein Pcaca01_38450 [Pectobacterium carotovorum subsp. carotovorum]
MAKVEVVPATMEHAQALLSHVRQADIDEFYAMSLCTPAEVLEQGLRISTVSWAGLIDGRVVTIFGVAPGSMLSGKGIPWLVGSDLLESHQKAFLRRAKPALAMMLRIYPRLENYVDERNVVAKAWLHWMGFKLEEAKPVGALGFPFHHFTMGE